MLDALLVYMNHRDVYGPVVGGGHNEAFSLSCGCGWSVDIALIDGWEDPQGFQRSVIARKERHEQLLVGDDDVPRFIERLREVNACDAVDTLCATVRSLGFVDACDVLAWCEAELVRGEPLDERWLGLVARACNAVLLSHELGERAAARAATTRG